MNARLARAALRLACLFGILPRLCLQLVAWMLVLMVLAIVFEVVTRRMRTKFPVSTSIRLPTMLANRHSRELSTGAIAAAGCLGVLIPPSLMLVVMAETTSIPVGPLFAAARVPGLLLSFLHLGHSVIACAIWPEPVPRAALAEMPDGTASWLGRVLRGFVPVLSLIAFVLGSIHTRWATPTEAAGVGCLGAALLAAMEGRLGATVFSYVFRITGGDELIIGAFCGRGLDSCGILLVLIFVLGIAFEWPEITLIVLPVFYPIVRTLDFGDHLQSAAEVMARFTMLCAVNQQTSFLTPPYRSRSSTSRGPCGRR